MCDDRRNTISYYKIYKKHYIIALQNISYDIGALTQVKNECLDCLAVNKNKLNKLELKQLKNLCSKISKAAKLLTKIREIMNDESITLDLDKCK